jgi:hypothetical protein
MLNVHLLDRLASRVIIVANVDRIPQCRLFRAARELLSMPADPVNRMPETGINRNEATVDLL